MSPCENWSEVVPRSKTPKRPTTCQIGLKKAPDIHVFISYEILDCLPLNKDQGEFKTMLINMSSEMSSAEYTTSYSASTPTWMMSQQIVGSGVRQGKVFKPMLNTD